MAVWSTNGALAYSKLKRAGGGQNLSVTGLLGCREPISALL